MRTLSSCSAAAADADCGDRKQTKGKTHAGWLPRAPQQATNVHVRITKYTCVRLLSGNVRTRHVGTPTAATKAQKVIGATTKQDIKAHAPYPLEQ